MKKISLVFKETSEGRIKDNLKKSSGLFIIGYSGVSSPDLSALRQSLKDNRARLFVVKNAVARRALKDAGMESLLKSIEGPCGLVFVNEEPADTSRVLYNFYKEHEQLKLECAILADRILNKEDIEALAKLPSKDVLRQGLVVTLNSPIAGLVYVLKGNLRKLAYCLQQIKSKKK